MRTGCMDSRATFRTGSSVPGGPRLAAGLTRSRRHAFWFAEHLVLIRNASALSTDELRVPQQFVKLVGLFFYIAFRPITECACHGCDSKMTPDSCLAQGLIHDKLKE